MARRTMILNEEAVEKLWGVGPDILLTTWPAITWRGIVEFGLGMGQGIVSHGDNILYPLKFYLSTNLFFDPQKL